MINKYFQRLQSLKTIRDYSFKCYGQEDLTRFYSDYKKSKKEYWYELTFS